MPNLNVTYAEMTAAATQLKRGKEQLESNLTAIRNNIDSLVHSGFITDQAAPAFAQSYNDYSKSAFSTMGSLSSLAGFLDHAVTEFTDTDTTLAASASSDFALGGAGLGGQQANAVPNTGIGSSVQTPNQPPRSTDALLADLESLRNGDFFDTAEELQAAREWWDSLSPAERAALIRNPESALIIGNTDGIPLGIRSQANRVTMREELSKVNTRIAELEAELNRTHGLQWRGQARVDELNELKEYAATLKKHLTAPTFTYDQNGRQVRQAGSNIIGFNPKEDVFILYHGAFDANGDIPSWIKNVNVWVPGSGTNRTNFGFDNGQTEIGARLYRDAAAVTDGGPSAFFVYAGGQFPAVNQQMVYTRYEDAQAPGLARLGLSIDQVRASDAKLRVAGYSYGSTIVGQAIAYNEMHPDEILLVAGAGLGKGVASLPADIKQYDYTRNSDVLRLLDLPGLRNLNTHGTTPRNSENFIHIQNDSRHTLSMIEEHRGVVRPDSEGWDGFVLFFSGNNPW